MNSLGKAMARKGALALIGALLLCSLILPVMSPSPVLAQEAVSIDLLVTGNGPNEIVNIAGYSVPYGEVTEDGVTVDKQTAMGALICYCQDNGIDITVTEGTLGAYVQQIGDNPDDENGWVYTLNEEVLMVGAAAQVVEDGDSVHWFNYTLGYYQLLLDLDKTVVFQGDDITATVT